MANQVVMQQSNTPTRLGQSGIQGGGFNQIQQIKPGDNSNPTFDFLMKMGNQVLGKVVEQREQELFLQGAQRVAQGEALADIVEEQPWITKIFGESASVQGARTIAQITQIDKFNADLLGNMDELAAIGPEEIGGIVNQKMREHLTGDPTADAVIMQKMAETSGTFYTQHTKAHVKYVQMDMQSRVTDMMIGAAGGLQLQAKGRLEGTVSDKDWDTYKGQVAGQLMPLAGQTAESYWGAVEQSVIDALAQGNHHFVNVVTESGLLQEAPSELRVKLLGEKRKYEAITREEAGYSDFGPEIGVLKAQAAVGEISPQEVVRRVDELNNQFKVRYGIDSNVFSRDELSAMVTGNIKKLYSRQEENLKARATAATDEDRQLRLATVLSAAGGNMAVYAGLGTQAEVNNGVWAASQAIAAKGGDPMAFLVETYNKGDKHVNPFVENQMNAAVRAATAGGEYNGDSFQGAYQLWRGMYDKDDGKSAAQAYLGDNSLRMEKFHLLTTSNTPPEIAFQMAFKEPLTKGIPVTEKEVQKVVSNEIDSVGPGFLDRILGHTPLTPSSRGLLSTEIAKGYEALTSIGVDAPAAVKRATDMATNTTDILGPYAVRRNPGEPTLAALLSSDPRTAGVLFEEAVAHEARKQGISNGLPGTGVGFTDLGPLGMAKKLFKGEKASAISATPPGMIRDLWNKTFSEDVGSQFINSTGVFTDPDTGLPYRIYTVYHTPADGTQPKAIVIDSRELRKSYEKSKKFSD